MTSLIERELSRTQFKSIVVIVWHVVEEVCKDEAVQILGGESTIRCFGAWCYACRSQLLLVNLELR